jgi:hypothetical protein
MATYEKPSLTDIGSVHELTLSTITKSAGSGDVIVINGVSQPADGRGVVGVS